MIFQEMQKVMIFYLCLFWENFPGKFMKISRSSMNFHQFVNTAKVYENREKRNGFMPCASTNRILETNVLTSRFPFTLSGIIHG